MCLVGIEFDLLDVLAEVEGMKRVVFLLLTGGDATEEHQMSLLD